MSNSTPERHEVEFFKPEMSEHTHLVDFVVEWLLVDADITNAEHIEQDLLKDISNVYYEFKQTSENVDIDKVLQTAIYYNIQVSPLIDPGHSAIIDYLENVAADRVADLKRCKQVQELLQKLGNN